MSTEPRRYIFGEWQQASAPMTVEEAERVCDQADRALREIANYPMDKIYAIFGRLKKYWADPRNPKRQFLFKVLPKTTGFSAEMIELGLKELEFIFDPEILKKKLATELRNIEPYGDHGFDVKSGTRLTWKPLGSILHVLSGNVFLVGAGSLVEGLLTRNVTILKQSSEEKLFVPLLIESLIECDPDGIASRSVAAVDYSSSQTAVMEIFKKRVDGVLVWGGEQAVQGYRNNLPARTRLIVFGPKLSLSIVSRNGLNGFGVEAIAEKLAFEVSVWDQNACTAPQLCFVETLAAANQLAAALPAALEKQAKQFPPGQMDIHTAVEIRKMRGVFEIAEARGQSSVYEAGVNLQWTVVVDPSTVVETCPLHRTIRIVPFDSNETVLNELRPLRSYIQTVGLATSEAEAFEWSNELASSGVLRIVPLGSMSGGEIDDPHDGAYDMPQLLNLVATRLPSYVNSKADGFSSDSGLAPSELWSQDQRKQLIDSRLRALIDRARTSSFYGQRFEGLKIETIEDLRRSPLLTRSDMEHNMPPQRSGLRTEGEHFGGYVSRSGGSTGEPKYSIYDAHDWDQMISHGAGIFRLMGLTPQHRLGNFMLAGDLYGSFVSFDHINTRVGPQTYGFSGNTPFDVVAKTWRSFQINAIQGVPAQMMPILRRLHAEHPDLKLDLYMYAGTPLAKSDREWLTQRFGVRRISSVIGANDGGQIAFQCEHLTGQFHHTVDDFNFIEILDDQNQPVPDGAPGKIVITSLLKYAYPLIRYELGDAGRIVPATCPCGSSRRIIEYLGRSDDMLAIGNMNLPYKDIAKALEHFNFSLIQVAGVNNEKGESIVIRVETSEHSSSLSREVRQCLLTKLESVSNQLDKGTLQAVDVVVYAPGELPRNPRTGKVKSIVDERQ